MRANQATQTTHVTRPEILKINWTTEPSGWLSGLYVGYNIMERWEKIFARDECRCMYCGESVISDLDIFHSATEDHLYPDSQGGSSSQKNLVTACHLCNSLKDDFIPEEYKNKKALDLTERGKIIVREEIRNDYIDAVRVEVSIRRQARVNKLEKHLQNISKANKAVVATSLSRRATP